MKSYLAVDIGASSGRHILGWVEDGKIVTEEIYRFENKLIEKNGRLCWDLDALFREIIAGLKICKERGSIPVSMGIDTWAVDFVLVDGAGKVLGDTVAYRDSRTQGMDSLVEEAVPFSELYARTGIQKQSFNTVYQLMAVKRETPELLEQAERFLMVPDYLHYRLTGKCSNEYTNATTTSLVDAEKKDWDRELLKRLGYPDRLFGPLSPAGTVLGGFSPEIKEALEFDCAVVLPATHDTGSAFLAVPAEGEEEAYLSSGTWSLMGVEIPCPVTTAESREKNFTNEGGFAYRFRYLKNIMGLWMIQSIRREAAKEAFPVFSEKPSFAVLETLAREDESFSARVDVEDQRFLAPRSMIQEIRAACRETGQPVPETAGEVMACVYHSLAECYRKTLQELGGLTGRNFTALHVVGGGSKDGYLNQLTANALGLPVYAGPAEGTALGNLMVQMIQAGEFAGLEEARAAERKSFAIQAYLPAK